MSPRMLAVCAVLASMLIAAAEPKTAPEFVPVDSAKPARRVGGAAVRCSEDPNLYVSVLAPANHVGYTASEQPVIYWYLSKATKDPVEIAITNLKNKGDAVLELELEEGVAKAGVQKLDLAAQKVRLAPGGEYELVIEVVTSNAAASRNASAVCRIARLAADQTAATPPASTSKSDLAAFYAKQGLWFDYVAALLDAVHAAPTDKSLLVRLGGSLKAEKLIWKEDGNIDELAKAPAE
jgi:hypothetical protein